RLARQGRYGQWLQPRWIPVRQVAAITTSVQNQGVLLMSHHCLLQRAVLCLLVLLLIVKFEAIAQAQIASKPNIVYIVADDLGWRDVGFNGCEDIKTPNIDKLAAEGAKLTQFYVQPMCTPTRAALMTGRYP